VVVIFEAFSEPYGGTFRAGHASNEEKILFDPFSPPVLKALRRFRLGLGVCEGMGRMNGRCRVQWAFPRCIMEEAVAVRIVGDDAERDWIDGGGVEGIWDSGSKIGEGNKDSADVREREMGVRAWLEEESEGEVELIGVPMNVFAARVILCQVGDLDEFLDLLPEERIKLFGNHIGQKSIVSWFTFFCCFLA